MTFLTNLFAADDCVPADACPPADWSAELAAVVAVSDFLTGVALLAVPAAAILFLWQGAGGRGGRLLWLGGAALGSIGLSHLASVSSLWIAGGGLEAAVKLVAMLVTGSAVLLLWPRLPRALAWPDEMEHQNHRLLAEVAQRQRTEDVLRETLHQLERRFAERTQELQVATVRLVERERALATKTELLETTLNAVDHGICIFGPDRTLRTWNAAYERLSIVPWTALREGLSLEELIEGAARAGVLGPGPPEDVMRARLAVLENADEPAFDDQVRPDGTVMRVGRFLTSSRHMVFTLTDVTRQRRLEEELRTANERYDLAVTGTNDGLFDWNVRTGELYLSPVWSRIVGHQPGDLPPRPSSWRMLVHPDDWPATRQELARCFESGDGRLQASHRLRHKAGHYVWIDARARVVRRADGRPIRVVGTITDITERRRAEEALRESEARFRTLYNQTPAMMHSVDGEKRLLSVSDHWLERLGYRRDEVIGRPLTDFMTPEVRENIPERFKALLDDGIVRDLPYQFVTADGHVLDVLLSAIAERHADGRFRQSLAVLSDVTVLRRLERELRESQERFEMATSATQAAVWDWDLGTDTIYFSPVWYELLGLRPRDGHQPRSFSETRVHPDDAGARAAAIEAHLAGRSPRYEATFRIRHADGRWIWVGSKGTVVRDERGSPYRMVGTMTDISARKEAEAKLEQYAEELRRSNQELEQFAYVAGHDLQEPLRMVIGYCELLQRRYQGRLDEDADTFIEFAVDGARRMRGLIGDLLAYSRVGSRTRPLAPVEPREVVRTAVQNLAPVIGETGARIEFGDLPPVSGDAPQLVQLFQNLIGNALKYRSAAPPEVRILAERRGALVEFAVCDNGIGIEPRYAERIFEIFKRLHTREAYPGSGIGLAICKRIIDRHGGRLWLDVGVRPGACFRFTLAAAERRPSRAAGDATAEPIELGSEAI